MSPTREPAIQPLALIAAQGKIIAVTCAVAVSISLVATLLLPKKYTATTRIFIEAPAGTDSRASTAVSPIYLDSLRTYELFASSDSLFLQAVEHFHLRQGGAAVDKLKKSILKVNVPRNTKILEITTTVGDPKLAHDLSLYLAEETVRINENTSRQGDREFSGEAERQFSAARKRMDDAQRAWDASPDQVAVETLRSEIPADEQLRDSMRKELTELEVLDPDANGPDAVRMNAYRRRLTILQDQITAKRKTLAASTAHLEVLESDLSAARRAYVAAEARLRELTATAGYRGERLRIIDPGIVPEHPSSPDLMLNLVLALVAGLVFSVAAALLLSPGVRGAAPRSKPISIAAK